MTRVLIVEDEAHLAEGLKFNLEAEGYSAEIAEHAEAALARLEDESRPVDLALVDVMLPGMDGFEAVRRLREAGRFLPVMMLTARAHTNDVVRGFEAGADDYVAKPFDLSVLLARIQSLLRRKTWLKRESTNDPGELEALTFGRNRLDLDRQVLSSDRGEQPLTLLETNLLRHLIRSAGRTVNRRTLLEDVWGVRHDTDTRAVDNFIVRLRRYIEADPSKPRHLLTVRGVGYRFVANPDEEPTSP